MPPEGLLVIDKPDGLTSHGVVARVRRLAGTRKVGHAGTLDPMATGVLVLGLGRATRLLGHLALRDKDYLATIRLGQVTVTDDREGELLATVDASGLDPQRVLTAAAALRGPQQQVPSAVSAIKVDGQRSYARVRAGEQVELAARSVQVDRFEVLAQRPGPGVLDLDVATTVSTGTYIRALARDLGAALGVGGHLTALRRTRVGPFDLAAAHPLTDTLPPVLSLGAALADCFPVRVATAEEAARMRHGKALVASGSAGPVALIGHDAEPLALLEDRAGLARPLVVFAAS